MSINDVERLLEVVKKKPQIDKTNSWSNGSSNNTSIYARPIQALGAYAHPAYAVQAHQNRYAKNETPFRQ